MKIPGYPILSDEWKRILQGVAGQCDSVPFLKKQSINLYLKIAQVTGFSAEKFYSS